MSPKTHSSLSHVTSRVGLALGSGSARGLAHIGVIRALQEVGIQIDFIAGTSIGALIGAVHASGKLDDLEKDYLNFDWKRIATFFDVVFPKSGLIDGTKVEAMVRAHVHGDLIEKLPIPFCAVATDIQTGAEVDISAGDITKAVRASIAVPGIFTPQRHAGRILVDGGLCNPVPVSAARMLGADIVIAVDLNHDIVSGKNAPPPQTPCETKSRSSKAAPDRPSGKTKRYQQSIQDVSAWLMARKAPGADQIARWASPKDPLPNIFEVLLASINIMETQVTRSRLATDRPDILIQPPLGHYRFLDFDKAKDIIDIGHATTRKALARSKLLFES
ncbi:patatin-like phospholipase family protein [Paucidesulfovibrio longus]|uniref:patatin-like phospholipase family protein n=1 Tax=Paucidesulfovibrio longus TaxID=889 RepID=UPI0009DBCF11|nr:patatin-like phospholipase family protein [Paucidesulfovibrio longus]